jgi:hypothetical protein
MPRELEIQESRGFVFIVNRKRNPYILNPSVKQTITEPHADTGYCGHYHTDTGIGMNITDF